MNLETQEEDSPASSGALPAPKLLVVAGCPRSGTTWLQLLLAQHPKVATCNETSLFVYVEGLQRRWSWEFDRSPSPRQVGLSRLLSQQEFDGLCRDFAAAVISKIGRLQPGAEIVLDKTPEHILQWELILKLFPDAYFLHVVRDPRGVAASMLAASRSPWGAAWASKTVVTAATRWREAIEAGRHLAKATDRFLEVRYESVLSDGPAQLERICEWLDLTYAPDFPAKAVEACRIENLRSGSSSIAAPWALKEEPPDFFRRGEANGWRDELRGVDVKTLEYLVRDLMVDVGYTPAVSGPLRKPFAVRLRDIADALAWRSQRLAAWLSA